MRRLRTPCTLWKRCEYSILLCNRLPQSLIDNAFIDAVRHATRADWVIESDRTLSYLQMMFSLHETTIATHKALNVLAREIAVLFALRNDCLSDVRANLAKCFCLDRFYHLLNACRMRCRCFRATATNHPPAPPRRPPQLDSADR